jgi:hypothetical protein
MKFFELAMEILGWCKIVLSPLIVGAALGGLAYLALRNIYGIMAGAALVLLGLLLGIKWANSVWREHGTMNFLSRIRATPDIPPLPKAEKTEKRKEV